MSVLSLRTLAHELEAADLRVGAGEVPDVRVSGVSQDSRKVGPGDLFLAWRGEAHDAHAFLADAAAAGAVAALVERPRADVAIPQIQVVSGRAAAALAADLVHGSPWRDLWMTAITGTNGKTTTAILTRWLLAEEGPAATIGTLGLTDPDGTVRPGTEDITTPGPVDVAAWLADLRGRGARSVTVEASSHALAQYRLHGVRFDAAVFTNVTQDHLDYHGDMPSYVAAKRSLVTLLKPSGIAIVNQDDRAWEGLRGPAGTTTFSTTGSADLRASEVRVGSESTNFAIEHEGTRVQVDLPLVGAFNVENALAATGAALAAGRGLRDIAMRLQGAPQVPGRLERVPGTPFTVLIDYAHTPDALRRALQVVRPLAKGRVIAVFGAGGDRDRKKRPLMGRAAAEGADVVVVTSDNPRTEDPEAIIDEIVPGLTGHDFLRIADRRSAVREALDLARPDDVVVLAGKGHETYQVLGTEKRPFDEREIVRDWLEERAA